MPSGFTARALSFLISAGVICHCRADNEAPPEAQEAINTKGFLGVMVGEVEPEVRAQVLLEPNQGLLIRMVAPGSPADTAGIKTHDILLKIKDRIVFSQKEFVSLVESSSPGAEVEVVWMRRGMKQSAKVVLGGAKVQSSTVSGETPVLDPTEWVAKLSAIIRTLQENPAAVEAVDRMLHGSADVDWQNHPLTKAGSYRIVCADSEGSVEICEHDGVKRVKVYDREDREIFSGLFSTPEQKAAAPAAIRRRVEKAEAVCGELTRQRKIREISPIPTAPAQKQAPPPAVPATPEPALPP